MAVRWRRPIVGLSAIGPGGPYLEVVIATCSRCSPTIERFLVIVLVLVATNTQTYTV